MMGHYVYLNQINNYLLYIHKIGVSLSLILFMSKAHAVIFDFDKDWQLESKTTLSLGASWSTQDPSASLLYRPDAKKIGKQGSSIDVNGDDGRMNFSKYDAISQIIRGITEVKLNGKQQGAVISTKYWYDHAYETGHGDLKAFNDSSWPRLAKFKGIDLWNAYIWKDFELGDGKTVNLKLGKQTLNWGKSQFFQNGLNSVSAFDFAAINRPGGDVKERMIPTEMFSFDTSINKNLKIEGFYQFKFRPSVVDGSGTFFEISDFVPENAGPVLLAGGGDKLSETAIRRRSYIPRTESRKAKDNGQYGIALKQTLANLNNAELGVYFANFHNRNANFDGTAVTAAGPEHFNTASYFSIYPENIKMFGLSLTGKVGTTTVFSELTHKPNQPLQLNGTDIVYAQVLSDGTPFALPGKTVELGQYIQGYVRLPVTQFSVGATDSIFNILGTDSLNWSTEFGLNHIANIGNHRIGRTGAFGRSELSTGAYNPETGAFKCTPYGTANLSNEEVDQLNESFCNKKGFFNEWSFGYRLRGALNYQNILPLTVFTPSLSFRHDVSGFSQNFQEGQMSVSAALSMTYQQKYTTEIAYNNFFGSNEFSTIDDRDFVSLTFKANF